MESLIAIDNPTASVQLMDFGRIAWACWSVASLRRAEVASIELQRHGHRRNEGKRAVRHLGEAATGSAAAATKRLMLRRKSRAFLKNEPETRES